MLMHAILFLRRRLAPIGLYVVFKDHSRYVFSFFVQ